MRKVTLVEGDGIGPEITRSVQQILEAAGAQIEWDSHEVGLAAYEKTGTLIPDEFIESLDQNGVALKGPTTTPVGGGHRAAAVHLPDGGRRGLRAPPPHGRRRRAGAHHHRRADPEGRRGLLRHSRRGNEGEEAHVVARVPAANLASASARTPSSSPTAAGAAWWPYLPWGHCGPTPPTLPPEELGIPVPLRPW